MLGKCPPEFELPFDSIVGSFPPGLLRFALGSRVGFTLGKFPDESLVPNDGSEPPDMPNDATTRCPVGIDIDMAACACKCE